MPDLARFHTYSPRCLVQARFLAGCARLARRRHIDRDRRWLVALAGVLAGLAVVTRYATVMMVPLLLLYGFSQRRLRRALVSLLSVAAVFGVWAAQNLVYHCRLHILASIPHYCLFYAGQSFDWIGPVKSTLGDIEGRSPVRLMSSEAKARYYSQHWGYLPFALSRAPLERVEILKVRTPAAAGESKTCASS